MYNFNVVPGLLESIKHESEAGKALDPEIALTLKVLLLTLKFQEVANFGMFFRVMQTIHFIHVCIRYK